MTSVILSTKYFLKKLLQIFLIIIGLILSVAIVFLVDFNLISHSKIKASREYFDGNYMYAENCYVDSNLIIDQTNEKGIGYNTYTSLVETCINQIPEHIRPYITDNWAIVFAKEFPEFTKQYTKGVNTEDSAATTVGHIKTIFVFEEDLRQIPFILFHEFGHALADEYGAMDYDPAFIELYDLYKDTYIEPYPYAVPGYASSAHYEFFAATISAYFTEPEWLEWFAPEIKDYMENILKDTPYSNFAEEIMVQIKGMIRKQ